MQSFTDSLNALFRFVGFGQNPSRTESVIPAARVHVKSVVKDLKDFSMNLGGARHLIRLAGLSGATAVVLAAYEAHGIKEEDDPKKKLIFSTANKFHLLHSVALLGVPLCSRPFLVGGLMTTGMVIFCGSCYVQCFTGNTRIRVITPYGGMLLILAWLAMIL